MLNLGSCLLRLCVPLTENESKMDKVVASYTGKITAVTEDKRLAHHHMQGLAAETCLVSVEEADKERLAQLSAASGASKQWDHMAAGVCSKP